MDKTQEEKQTIKFNISQRGDVKILLGIFGMNGYECYCKEIEMPRKPERYLPETRWVIYVNVVKEKNSELDPVVLERMKKGREDFKKMRAEMEESKPTKK